VVVLTGLVLVDCDAELGEEYADDPEVEGEEYEGLAELGEEYDD